MRWWEVFGPPLSGQTLEVAKSWLSSLTLMQLCAVCVIGRFLESVNIPYRLATVVDAKGVKKFAAAIAECYPYVSATTISAAFENFLFYFNLEDQGKQGASPTPDHTDATYQQAVNSHTLLVAEAKHADGLDSELFAAALEKLAAVYHRQGKEYAKAEPLYKQAIDVYIKANGPNDPSVAHCLEQLAQLYREFGKDKKAKETEIRASKIRASQ